MSLKPLDLSRRRPAPGSRRTALLLAVVFTSTLLSILAARADRALTLPELPLLIATEAKLRSAPLDAAARPAVVHLIRELAVLTTNSGDPAVRGEALMRAALLYTDLFRAGHEEGDAREAGLLFERLLEHVPGHSLAPAACLRGALLLLERRASTTSPTDTPSYGEGYRRLLDCAGRFADQEEGREASRLLGMLRVMRPPGVAGPAVPVPVGPSGIPGEVIDSARLVVPAAKAPARLHSLTYVSNASFTRVIAHLDRPVHYSAGEAAPGGGLPARLYIDLNDTSRGPAVSDAVPVGDGLLRGARVADFTRTTTRVVLDLDAVGRFRVFPLRAPFRVVVDLFPKSSTLPPPAGAAGYSSIEDLETALAASGRSLSELAGLRIDTIVLDPGHGGDDTGALAASGLAEKDVNLDIASKLAPLLRARLGVTVVLTRNSDTTLPLEERSAMANAAGADLFVSIHTNAAERSDARGIEVYHLDLAVDESAMRVAARENATGTVSLADLSSVLGELVHHSNLEDSGALAAAVQRALVDHVRGVHPDTPDRGTRTAMLYVLLGAQMPAVLVETSFLSNPTEAGRLATDGYRARVAEGIAEGIAAFVKGRAP